MVVIQEMGQLVSLKQQQKDSATYQAAVAARAATGAAAANLRKRCNQCEACLTSQVCLLCVMLIPAKSMSDSLVKGTCNG